MPRKQRESQRRLGQYTQIYRNRWQDRAYTMGLTWNEKAMLDQLTTFDGISAAGVVRADARILAGKHPDVDPSQITEYLAGLSEKKWIAQSGMEIFVRDWFIQQPVQLRGEKNVRSMVTAIDRVGYDDLRATVADTLFDALLTIEQLDKTPTVVAIKKLCTQVADHHGLDLPAGLNGTTRK